MSKYGNSRPDSKNFKFFSLPVSQIFDSKHGSPEDYSDFFCFCFCFFSSSRSRAMRSPCHNFSKILSNQNEILQTWSEVNIVVPNTFWVHSSVEGCWSWGTSKWTNILRISPCFFRQSFKHRDFHEDIYLQNPNGWTDFDAQWLIGSTLSRASGQMSEIWFRSSTLTLRRSNVGFPIN